MNYYTIHPKQYLIPTEIKIYIYCIAHLIYGNKFWIIIHNSLLDKMTYYQVTTYNHFIAKNIYNHFYNKA